MSKFIKSYRLVTFVPTKNAQEFIAQISDHIPAFLGEYEKVCYFTEAGTEQYAKKREAQIHQEPSTRVEISLPKDKKALCSFIEDVLKPAHPWEEPVILVSKEKIYAHD